MPLNTSTANKPETAEPGLYPLHSRLARFQEQHGRPPKMLHIGNIANNAYNNAKLMNELGFDCDVICYDYYHSMACPEWEDADFEGDIIDESYPAWERVNLGGFRRQKWFAQGNRTTAMRYLKARRDGKTVKANLWWKILNVRRMFIGITNRSQTAMTLRRLLKASRFYLMLFVRCLFSRVRTVMFRHIEHSLKACRTTFARTFLIEQLLQRLRERTDRSILLHFRRYMESQSESHVAFARRPLDVVAAFAKAFPDRPDQLSLSDVLPYQNIIIEWKELFDRYDLILAYSTDPILPMLAGTPYFALEHGTLREIPFHDSTQGRLTALAYHRAEHVFVTNADCFGNAKTLAGERVTFINHPFDDKHGLNVVNSHKLREQLQKELGASFLLFFPTRQDWVPDTGYADKGNDVFLRAFAQLRLEGLPIGMVCCRWGANVKQSQLLLSKLGVEQYVKWQEPMGIVQFERMARASHLVVDQFKLGSFGGVLFKSLAAGVPCCTYLDDQQVIQRFGETIPAVNACTTTDIVNQLRKVLNDPGILDDLSSRSRQWIENHHSSRDILQKQFRQFFEFLEGRAAIPQSTHHKSIQFREERQCA